MKAVEAFPDITIPKEEKSIFQNNVYFVKLAEGEEFISLNSVCNKIGFIHCGEMHSIMLSKRKPIVVLSHYNNQFVSVFTGILTGEPSNRCIRASRPTRLTVIPGPLMFQLIARHPCWIQFWINIMGTQLHDLNEVEKHTLRKTGKS